MTVIGWRGRALLSVSLALISTPSVAQDVLTLDEALRRSGVEAPATPPEPNPRIVGPVAEAEAARALVDQARLRPNPELSFEAENIAGTGAFSGLSATEYTLSVGQRIELGGKRSARIRSAQAEVAVADIRATLAVADLALNVRERYVAAVAAQARVELAQDVVQRSRELARIAGELVKAGREPPLRSLRASATLAEAEAQLEAAQAASLAARSALGALWGADSVPPQVSTSFPGIDPPAALLASRDALALRLASAEREAARADIARQWSLATPDPVVSAGVRRFAESDDQAFLVGVSIPLPFWNRNQGNVAAAQSRLRAATAREAVAQTEYEQQVTSARAEYLAAETREQTLSESSLPQAEEALRLVRIGYRAGRFPLIEVLSAAEARDGIREALIQAREARGRAAARLLRLAAQGE